MSNISVRGRKWRNGKTGVQWCVVCKTWNSVILEKKTSKQTGSTSFVRRQIRRRRQWWPRGNIFKVITTVVVFFSKFVLFRQPTGCHRRIEERLDLTTFVEKSINLKKLNLNCIFIQPFRLESGRRADNKCVSWKRHYRQYTYQNRNRNKCRRVYAVFNGLGFFAGNRMRYRNYYFWRATAVSEHVHFRHAIQ